MSASGSLPYSKEHINRCGALLRAIRSGDYSREKLDGIEEAIEVLNAFRAAHQNPQIRVTMGVRSFVKTETRPEPMVVAQRLKRTPQIVSKLVRFPGMSLARMEDIGGCRAVLGDVFDLRAVEVRLARRWADQVKHKRDYIANPKPEGYRGVHYVVERSGRRIEVQLRTQGQQAWANAVETFASRYNLPLKDGEGPEPVLNYFRLAAAGIERDELGLSRDAAFDTQFAAVVSHLRHWLEEQTRGGE